MGQECVHGLFAVPVVSRNVRRSSSWANVKSGQDRAGLLKL